MNWPHTRRVLLGVKFSRVYTNGLGYTCKGACRFPGLTWWTHVRNSRHFCFCFWKNKNVVWEIRNQSSVLSEGYIHSFSLQIACISIISTYTLNIFPRLKPRPAFFIQIICDAAFLWLFYNICTYSLALSHWLTLIFPRLEPFFFIQEFLWRCLFLAILIFTLSLARARAVSRAHFLLPSHCTRVQMHIFRIYIHTCLSLSLFASNCTIYIHTLSRARTLSRASCLSHPFFVSLSSHRIVQHTHIPSLARALFLAPISLSFRRHRKKKGIFFST